MKFKIIDWHRLTTFSEADKQGVGNPGKKRLPGNNDSSPPLYALDKKAFLAKESRLNFPRKNKKDKS